MAGAPHLPYPEPVSRPTLRILALDLGTHCGWAMGKDAQLLESGTQIFDVRRGESPGMRYVRFRAWLNEMLVSVRLVIFEQAHHRGGAATEVASGFSTRVLELCAERRIEHCSVHSSTLKKFSTGRGNAKKPEMIEAARRLWPQSATLTDDNEADALHLLNYAIKSYGGLETSAALERSPGA